MSKTKLIVRDSQIPQKKYYVTATLQRSPGSPKEKVIIGVNKKRNADNFLKALTRLPFFTRVFIRDSKPNIKSYKGMTVRYGNGTKEALKFFRDWHLD